MKPKLKTYDSKTPIDVLYSTLDEEGYVVITGLLNDLQLEWLNKDLKPYFDVEPNCSTNFWGHKTQRISALLNKSRVCQEMVLDPIVCELTGDVLLPNCESYQLSITQGIKINPGEIAQMIHPDTALYRLKNKDIEHQVNAIWACTDFTTENGGTQLVPGSHKWPEGRVPEENEIIYAEMPAGSALIYQARMLHGGGANTTSNQSRIGIAVAYVHGWLRQSENQYLSYSRETVSSFPEDLQELMGYSVHAPNLGWVHGTDPYEFLHGIENKGGAKEFLTDGQNELVLQHVNGEKAFLTEYNVV